METEYSRSGTEIVDLAVEQGAGHDDALDLVGALVDLSDFRVAHHPLDGEIPRITVTTEQLHRIGRYLHRHVGGEALGCRGDEPDLAPVALGPRRSDIDQLP